jgi:hypothetical protein
MMQRRWESVKPRCEAAASTGPGGGRALRRTVRRQRPPRQHSTRRQQQQQQQMQQQRQTLPCALPWRSERLPLPGAGAQRGWVVEFDTQLDSRFMNNLSQADFNRLSSCITGNKAVATPEELASVTLLAHAPGAAPPSAAVNGLCKPATVARGVAAKLFLRLSR